MSHATIQPRRRVHWWGPRLTLASRRALLLPCPPTPRQKPRYRIVPSRMTPVAQFGPDAIPDIRPRGPSLQELIWESVALAG